jgi:hypothetical protein
LYDCVAGISIAGAPLLKRRSRPHGAGIDGVSVFLNFRLSGPGATHHLCGIFDADAIARRFFSDAPDY